MRTTMKALVVILLNIFAFFSVAGIASAGQAGDQSTPIHNGGSYAPLRAGEPPPGGDDYDSGYTTTNPPFYCLGPASGYCGA
jgi:hypothetical protein